MIPPSGFLLDQRVFPSLGILRVASMLERAGHDVSVLDMSGAEEIADVLGAAPPSDWYGITATTPQLPAAVTVSRWLARHRPGARRVLGGPHVTLSNAAARKGTARARVNMEAMLAEFDVLVAGDGEQAVFATLDAECPRVVDADDPKGALWMTEPMLDIFPVPARHMIDLSSYHYSVNGRRAGSIVGQLGCPFGCSFCGGRSSPTFRRVRLRSTEHVIDELRLLHTTYGYTGFMWMDDELNVNPAMLPLMRGITGLQDELGVEFRMRGFIKSQLLTEGQAAALYSAGFREILVGFEAADDRILHNIRKKATIADNERCLDVAHSAGLRVKALMSIGHAGETEGTVLAVRDWLLKVQPDDFDVTIITVYPGTPYFDEAVEHEGVCTFTTKDNGDRLHYWALDFTKDVPYYKGIPGTYQAYVWTDALSSDKIVTMRDAIETEVRGKLGIAWPQKWQATTDHSMGQQALAGGA